MFGLFKSKNEKKMNEIEQALQNLTHLNPSPIQAPAAPPPQEHYRIGFNQELDMITVTLISGGTSMTLSLDRPELVRFKNMLDAAASVDVSVSDKVTS
jgi:hypothetical protein